MEMDKFVRRYKNFDRITVKTNFLGHIIAHANNQEEAFQELKFVEKAYNGLVEYKQLQSPKSK